MTSLKQIPIMCGGHTRPIVDVRMSGITPYGYFIISSCKDGKPMLRQGDTGDWIGTFLGHKGAVFEATINKEATRAATASTDYTVKVWNAESGDEVLSLDHKRIVKGVDFTADSVHLLTGCGDNQLRIYDLNQPDAEPRVLPGHSKSIKSCRFTPDGRKIVSSSDDCTVRVWDVHNGETIKTLKYPDNYPACSIELAANGSRLVLTYDNKVAFYDTDSWELVKEFEIPTKVFAASYLQEKNIFVCGGHDFLMYRYDYSTGEELEAAKSHFGAVHCVQFSPDGEIYASGAEDGTLRLWQTTVGKTYGLWKYESGPAGDSEGVTNPSPPLENGGFNKSATSEGQT